MSKSAIEVTTDHEASIFLENAVSVKGIEHLTLADVIYRNRLPLLIRRLKGAKYSKSHMDSLLYDIFLLWYEKLYENAKSAGMDVKKGMPYPEEIFRRFAEMWDTTEFGERDWVWLTHRLIRSRQACISRGAGTGYPQTLQDLEMSLVARDVRLSSTEAAGVLLMWVMAEENSDGVFFVSQRDLGRWSAAIVVRELDDENHAKVIGRATISRCERLGIIAVHKRGKSYRDAGRANAEATSYRWIWRNAKADLAVLPEGPSIQ